MIKMRSLLNGGIIYANEESAHSLLGSFEPVDGEEIPEPHESEGQFTTYSGPLVAAVSTDAEVDADTHHDNVDEIASEPAGNEQVDADPATGEVGQPLTIEQLKKLKVSQIADYAQARGIDLAGCSKKQDMLDAIAEAE